MNYYFGTGDPVVFVQRRGILVPNVEGRKWSQDPLNFNDALYIPQKSNNGLSYRVGLNLVPVNIENQMLFFAADGSIKNVVDNQYFDEDYSGNQIGYQDGWIGVLGENSSMSHDKLIGARMWATGNGPCAVTAYNDQDQAFALTGPLTTFLLTLGLRTRMDIPMPVQGAPSYSMRWAVGMSNTPAGQQPIPGNWWFIYKSDLMVIPTWPGQPG
jgi:hypothetical protein